MLLFSAVLIIVLASTVKSENESKKPNIVLFLTDDQDYVLGGMNPMKNVQRFIANEGAVFSNCYVASPICCPSRASILTGMYPHNHGTTNNSITGGCNGNTWKIHEEHTFATVLKYQGGYNTFYAGKYLNKYGIKEAGGPEVVPPGWSEWHGLVGNSVYYDYVMSNNGVTTHSTDLYLTDVIRDLSLSFIENQTESQPFLMVLAPPAPHQPFTPAPRHRGVFSNISVHRNPSFNVFAKDKHWLMQMSPSPLPEDMLPELDDVYHSRWETLLAVDEMVADVIGALEIHSLLDDTYIIFTSDNGFHIGQFSQVFDKRQPYETDIKVPFLIRGPRIQRNITIEDPIMNIDIAPTIIDLARLNIPKNMDGVPMNMENNSGVLKERNMLIEYHGEGSLRSIDPTCPCKYDHNLSECYPAYRCKCQDSKNNTYGCIRHLAPKTNFKYCYFMDDVNFEEMYDLSQDPYELTNIVHEVMPSIKHWYRLTLAEMLKCQGSVHCSNPITENMIRYV